MSVSIPTSDIAGHVRIVDQLYQAFMGGRVEEILPLLAHDVVWTEPDNPFNPGAGTRHGHAGFLEWLRVGHAAEEILVIERQYYLTNADTVAVVGMARCRVRQTGRAYETDFVHLIRFREGRVVHFQEFFDTYAAAEAFRQV